MNELRKATHDQIPQLAGQYYEECSAYHGIARFEPKKVFIEFMVDVKCRKDSRRLVQQSDDMTKDQITQALSLWYDECSQCCLTYEWQNNKEGWVKSKADELNKKNN